MRGCVRGHLEVRRGIDMDMKVIGFAILGLAIAGTIFMEVKKRTIFAKIERYFSEQDYASCLELLDKTLTQMVYPRYNQLFMRLNCQMGLENVGEATRIIDEMMGLKMNREQQLALYSKAFAFFVENEDKSRAEKVLESIEKMGDEGLTQVSRETFEIFLNHSDKYLDQMLARLDEAGEGERLRLYQLIAVQYENRNDSASADAYYKKAVDALDALQK